MFEALGVFGFYLLLSALTMIGFAFVQIRFGSTEGLNPDSFWVRSFRKRPSWPKAITQWDAEKDPLLKATVPSEWLLAERAERYASATGSKEECAVAQVDFGGFLIEFENLVWQRQDPSQRSRRHGSFVDEVTEIVDRLSSSEKGAQHEYLVTREGDVLIRPCKPGWRSDPFELEGSREVPRFSSKPN